MAAETSTVTYDQWKTRSPDDELVRGLPYEDEPEHEELRYCPECSGEGSIEHPRPFWDDPYFCIVVPCSACTGAGFLICEAADRLTIDDLDERCGA